MNELLTAISLISTLCAIVFGYYQENDVIPYIQDLGIVVQGWYPLGGAWPYGGAAGGWSNLRHRQSPWRILRPGDSSLESPKGRGGHPRLQQS